MSGPNKPPPSSEQKFVNRFVSSFVQWAPLGGSGGAFLSFLIQQDWMISLFLFPVTAVSGIWAAYSRNFIERLSEIYAERGREDANALVKWLDSLNEALKWQFSGVDEQYLKLQAKQVSEYVTEGFNPLQTAIPLLEDVFVPLELSGFGVETLSKEELEASSCDRLRIWDFIRRSQGEEKFRQIVIQAKGGFGKTTLLRHIAWIYGKGKHKKKGVAKRIPFLLHLRDWRHELTRIDPPSLKTIIEFHIAKLDRKKELKLPPQWIEKVLGSGVALVMLDGFDEIPETKRGSVSDWIAEQMETYDSSTFILTSRPEGYKAYKARRPNIPLFVKKFTAEQQADFVNRWYLCQEQSIRSKKQASRAETVAKEKTQNLLLQLQDPDRPELRQMAENPLLLNMLATFHRFDPGVELPRKRVDLYKGMCKLLLDDRPRARGIQMLLDLEKSQGVLQGLALKMVSDNRPSISRSELLETFECDPILKAERVTAEDFLTQQLQTSELIVERDANEYEFPHLSFQGYLAAAELKKQEKMWLVLENWEKSWWKETILLYTSQLSPLKFGDVITAAYGGSELAAQLAAQCFRDYTRPEKIDPDLRATLEQLQSKVQTSVFHQLETFLANGQWREGDNETYRLMITTVGKEPGEWFYPEELLNFPSEELLAIDALWVKHSHGKFGFSVQKDLYLSVGGVPDGKYHENAWDKFCHANGWAVNKNYVNITYHFDAPRGHLPTKIKNSVNLYEHLYNDRFSSLLSHRDL